MNRSERRRIQRERARARKHSAPIPTQSYDPCRFPHLFQDPDACCICGHGDASECPCDPMTALVHGERAHPEADLRGLRDALGCPLPDSEPTPRAQGTQGAQGMFEAPCDSPIAYATTAWFPTLAHYRWHAIYDHLKGGACSSPSECEEAISTGGV